VECRAVAGAGSGVSGGRAGTADADRLEHCERGGADGDGTGSRYAGGPGRGRAERCTTPQQWGDSQQEMRLVAADTGGEAYYNTNAVGKAVADAIADGENYYTLGYAPSEAKTTGAYHTITVRLRGGEV